VSFERINTDAEDYQGTAVINYPDPGVRWTRIHEHKHFAPWETHAGTVVFREYSRETSENDQPFYPKRLACDKELLLRYVTMARSMKPPGHLSKRFGATFLGRLATYRYMDMETVIGEALEVSRDTVAALRSGGVPPVFPDMG